MSSPRPIPIPWSARWREFRVRYVPLIFFALLVGAIGVMLKYYSATGNLHGIGEGVRSLLAAPQPARIEQWLVAPYTIVEQGTAVAVLSPVDARADFDLLRSLFEMARVRLQPSLAENNAMNFERIRVELLKTRSELAVARVKLELAERDVLRNTPLYKEKLVAEDIYELSVNARDALKAEVEEKAKASSEIEHRLEELRSIGEPDALSNASAIPEWLSQLEQAQASAASNLQPLTLLAPITGMTGVPLRQPGEFVLAGEPLLAINALRSDRVVAYLRQPYPLEPKVGMPARVTTRTKPRQVFWSHIEQIGAHMEILTNSLAIVRPDALVDVALPVMLPVPDDITVRPGEIVDLLIPDAPTESSSPVPSAKVTLIHQQSSSIKR